MMLMKQQQPANNPFATQQLSTMEHSFHRYLKIRYKMLMYLKIGYRMLVVMQTIWRHYNSKCNSCYK